MNYIKKPAVYGVAWLNLAVLALVGCGGASQPLGEILVEPSQVRLAYPGFAKLEFEIKALADIEGDSAQAYVFVHLLDAVGVVVRTFDHPVELDWVEGAERTYDVYLYQSALAPPLESGEYQLSVGIYDEKRGRWPIRTSGDSVGRREHAISTVTVKEDQEGAPMFYFSPTWLSTESGTDKQILGRRWLTEAGAVRLAEMETPGRVWLRIKIPQPETGFEEQILADGAAGPEVRISSPCGEFESVLSGVGTHDLMVPVEQDATGALPAECEIRLEPNFHLVNLDTLDRRAISLEILSWATKRDAE